MPVKGTNIIPHSIIRVILYSLIINKSYVVLSFKAGPFQILENSQNICFTQHSFHIFSTVKCHLSIVNYLSTTVKSYFKFILSHKNIILISNLTITNVYIETHISIPNIQNGQPKTIIPNENGQNNHK